MENISNQVFLIKDVPTKTVTLYPSRAHVVREIPNIELQPGQNEIELYGLSPTVDEDSIQIEGRGSATITDITVDLVPNRDHFLEEFPDESESEDSESEEFEDSDDDIDSVKAVSKEIKAVSTSIEDNNEIWRSMDRQLLTLDQHSKSITAEKCTPEELAKTLSVYQEERGRLFKKATEAKACLKTLEKKKKRLETQRERAGKEEQKKKKRAQKEKAKLEEKRLRQKIERQNEANRTKREREKFWPQMVYRVVVRLETVTDTPQSSRRNSLDSVTLSRATPEILDKLKDNSSLDMNVTLALSYVTTAAFWSPRYDLNISSVQKTATIVYRAEFRNGTSETWKDAKLILSTSQTSYSGLEDKAPAMNAWHIRLGRFHDTTAGLMSNDEMPAVKHQKEMMKKSRRAELMGPPARQDQSSAYSAAPHGFGGSREAARSGGGLFASPVPPPAASQQMQVPSGNTAMPQMQMQSLAWEPEMQQQMPQASKLSSDARFGGEPAMDSLAVLGGQGSESLDFEESSWEDYGLTATYDVPGKRTLSPSSLLRRHKIATLLATQIGLSYMSVPKLRAAAFLRARIRNPSSSVTLLKGIAGVTLDGSFLGNMSLQRVSPGQSINVGLGVDPAIHVSYSKPTVHRSTQGIFNKESSHSFNRSILLTNTKAAPVELLVLDQVPVSQEERLKIEIIQPRGLYKEGDSIKTGHPAKAGNSPWGKAVANLKKNGEVAWTVNLEKGQACLLKLDYDARLPSNEAIITA